MPKASRHVRTGGGDPSLGAADFAGMVEWEYSVDRLSGALQKILIIHPGLQRIVLRNLDLPPLDWVVGKRERHALTKMLSRIHFAVIRKKPTQLVGGPATPPQSLKQDMERHTVAVSLDEEMQVDSSAMGYLFPRPDVNAGVISFWTVLPERLRNQ
jgi:hypothetical protein